MNVVLWVLAALLAVAFLGAGLLKLTQPKAALASKGMAWTEDFSAGAVKAIGVLEILGALGIILPGAVDIAPILVPIAATGLALTMLGAVIVHIRRGETKALPPALILMVLAVVLAILRFGPEKFTS